MMKEDRSIDILWFWRHLKLWTDDAEVQNKEISRSNILLTATTTVATGTSTTITITTAGTAL
jgi:hypothetical protein